MRASARACGWIGVGKGGEGREGNGMRMTRNESRMTMTMAMAMTTIDALLDAVRTSDLHTRPSIHSSPSPSPCPCPNPYPCPCPWPCPTCPVLPALPYLPCPTCPTLPALPCHACHPSPSKVHSYINNPPSSSNTTPPQPFHRHQPTIPSSPVPTPGPRRLDSQIHLTVKGNGITEGNGKVREGKCEGRRGKGDVK